MMAIFPCDVRTDSSGRELTEHGTQAFPVACYEDDLTMSEVPWHWHEELEAAVMVDGQADFAVDGCFVRLEAGDGYFFNQNILHGAWNGGKGICRLHSIVFHPRLIGEPDSVFWRNYVQPILEDSHLMMERLSPAAVEHLETAWHACKAERDGFELETRYALSRLLSTLLPRTQDGSGRSPQNTERVKRMLSFMQQHLSEPLTVREIADAAALSESECIRCFKKAIFDTPIHYLRKLRIQRAAALIASGERRITHTAEACGFHDLSYFTRCFRQQMGMTPMEYRRRVSERKNGLCCAGGAGNRPCCVWRGMGSV